MTSDTCTYSDPYQCCGAKNYHATVSQNEFKSKVITQGKEYHSMAGHTLQLQNQHGLKFPTLGPIKSILQKLLLLIQNSYTVSIFKSIYYIKKILRWISLFKFILGRCVQRPPLCAIFSLKKSKRHFKRVIFTIVTQKI